MMPDHKYPFALLVTGSLLFLISFSAYSQQVLNTDDPNVIAPHETASDMRWGASVALQGDTLFISAAGQDAEEDPGLVWQMVFNGEGWEYDTMMESPGNDGDGFGSAVAVADSILAIGAPYAENSDGDETGMVYLYLKNNDNWELKYELSPDALSEGARFGHSVAADSGRVIAGAPGQEGYDELESAGIAYIFDLTRNPGEMPPSSRTNVAMPSSNEQLGFAVDIKGDRAVVSTQEAGMVIGPRNRVFLFEQVDPYGNWRSAETMPGVTTNWPQYGFDVALSGESVLIGYPREQGDGSQVGGVYAYPGIRTEDGIGEPDILTPAHPSSFLNYGSGVSVFSETLAVTGREMIEIFNWNEGEWSRKARFAPDEVAFSNPVDINGRFIVAAGHPDTDEGYLSPAVYWHQLDAVTSTEEEKGEIAAGYELDGAYPNPFNPSAVIQYRVPEQTHVRLEVFDLMGRRISVLEDGVKAAGEHAAVFNGSQFASGVYIYTLTAGNNILTKKMTMVQ